MFNFRPKSFQINQLFQRFSVALLLFIVTAAILPISIHALSGVTFDPSTTSLSLKQGESKTINLTLDTAGYEVVGTDIALTYNHQIVHVEKVTTTASPLFDYNFFINDFITNPTNAALRITSTMADLTNTVSGRNQLVTLTIRGNQVGNTSIKFTCTNGSTSDTNVTLASTAADIVDCGSLDEISIQVVSSTATGGTSASPTPSPSPTTCSLPSAPSNLSAFNIDSDTVLLRWDEGTGATNHHLFFGTDPNSYQFGAANFGNTDQILVNFLRPATTYYFAISSVNDCGVSTSDAKITKTTFGSTSTSTNTGGTTGSTSPITPRRTPTPTPFFVPNANYTTPTPTATPLPSITPTPFPTPAPEIDISEEELADIPSINSPLDTDSDRSPIVYDEIPSEQLEESQGPNLLLLFAIPIILIIVGIGIFALVRSRSQTPPPPPQDHPSGY